MARLMHVNVYQYIFPQKLITMTITNYLLTGILAAIAYCSGLLIFFSNEIATNSWILYLGNFAFTAVIVIAATIINKRLHDETSISKMMTIGLKLNFASIIITIPFMVALFYLFGNHIMPSSTSNNTSSTTLLMLFMNLVFVNIFMGSFAVLLSALIFNQYLKNSNGQDIT